MAARCFDTQYKLYSLPSDDTGYRTPYSSPDAVLATDSLIQIPTGWHYTGHVPPNVNSFPSDGLPPYPESAGSAPETAHPRIVCVDFAARVFSTSPDYRGTITRLAPNSGQYVQIADAYLQVPADWTKV